MKKILFIALCLSPFLLQADILSQLETYIRVRSGLEAITDSSRCGFRNQLLLHTHFHELSPAMQALAAPLLKKPVRQKSRTSPSGHFTLHYDTSGVHAVPPDDVSGNRIPDYLDSAAVILDHVWDYEINGLGFKAPPDSVGQPVNNYPVYFSSMGDYGLTTFDPSDDIPELPGNNFTSYIELHCDYEGSQFKTKGLAALKVTAAHEFNHAIQLGYHLRIDNDYDWPDLYFMEMTSTFMEDEVYPDVNDYVFYLKNLFQYINIYEFDHVGGNAEYANSIYLHMLRRQYNAQAAREIWERIPDYPAVAAIDNFLHTKNSSFAESHNQYACWLYFTGERSRPLDYFPDGGLYPKIAFLDSISQFEKPLNPLRMRFIQYAVRKSGLYAATVSASGTDSKFSHVVNGETILKPAAINSSQWFIQNKNSPLIVALTNSGDSQLTDINYGQQIKEVTTVNNPVCVRHGSGTVTFVNVPQNCEIKIYSVQGRLVRTIRDTGGASGQVDWNLHDWHGRSVASGNYFFTVRAEGIEQHGKFILLR